jgi:hypothetical protein
VSGPCLPTKNGSDDNPPIGALSDPVENYKNFILCLLFISLWITSHNQDIIWESFV